MRMLVAIPCLNEADTIERVVTETLACRFSTSAGRVPIESITCLVVDDGSTDATARLARDSGAEVISHGCNRGVGAAFRTGVRFARSGDFDVLVTIDADNQFDPHDIPKLLAPILGRRAAFVTASRFVDPAIVPEMPRLKLWANKGMSSLVSCLVGQRVRDVSCGFRAYSKVALSHLRLRGDFTYTQETLLNLCFGGIDIVEIPVEVQYFPGRRSRVAANLVRYAFETSLVMGRTFGEHRLVLPVLRGFRPSTRKSER